MKGLDQIRERLLKETIRYAVMNSSYYSSKLRTIGQINSISDLFKLPIIYKETLQNQNDQVTCLNRFPDYIMYTSGTTGNRLSIPIIEEEVQVIRRFFSKKTKSSNKPLKLRLYIIPVGDGATVFMPDVPRIPVHINYGIKHAVEILQGRYSYPNIESKITILEGQLPSIYQFTTALLKEGFNPATFGITTIYTGGDFVTRRFRKFLEDVWKASIIDRYGLSEIHGHSTLCPLCNWYHFGISVIPEVLHPTQFSNISNGIGALVLTGLYPFHLAQLKIRYWTGDFVEVRSNLCTSNEPSYLFKGRINQTVYITDDRDVQYLIFPTDIVQILDEFPEVSRIEPGNIKFRLDNNLSKQPIHSRLLVELIYYPEFYPNRINELRRLIVNSLKEENQTFKNFLDQKLIDFQIDFIPPTKLENFYIV